MTPVIKNHARAFMLSLATAAVLTSSLHADCTYELFNIASIKGTTVGEFVDQISDECGMSVIVTDEQAENILKKPMNKTFLKNLTINEVLDLIIKENNLQYTLSNNILKVSYLTTKTYHIDYISGKRKGIGSTNVRLSSNSGTAAGSSGTTSTASGTSNSSESGINITNEDEVNFWESLEKEVKSVLSRPEDDYRQKEATAVSSSNTDQKSLPVDTLHDILINKNAGLITVTGTGKQIKRLDTYIDSLQKKMQTQVLIDVKMYSVVFSDSSSTGIDWSQLYALQNIDLGFNYYNTRNVKSFTAESTGTSNIMFPITEMEGTDLIQPHIGQSIFQVGVKGSLNEVIKFLKTQGDVYSISNPKVLTLNNQPALITAGTELFYKTKNTSTLAGGTTGEQATTEVVSSVFSGVLLDITPEIADDGTITLRINPSISETASAISTDNATRSMPPDLSRRQLSSVVSVKDGNRVIMGGLINTKNVTDDNKVPLLGDIPVLGYLFKREGVVKKTEEIVIIIEPRIIKKEKDSVSLGDLGYTRLGKQIEEDSKGESK